MTSPTATLPPEGLSRLAGPCSGREAERPADDLGLVFSQRRAQPGSSPPHRPWEGDCGHRVPHSAAFLQKLKPSCGCPACWKTLKPLRRPSVSLNLSDGVTFWKASACQGGPAMAGPGKAGQPFSPEVKLAQ